MELAKKKKAELSDEQPGAVVGGNSIDLIVQKIGYQLKTNPKYKAASLKLQAKNWEGFRSEMMKLMAAGDSVALSVKQFITQG